MRLEVAQVLVGFHNECRNANCNSVTFCGGTQSQRLPDHSSNAIRTNSIQDENQHPALPYSMSISSVRDAWCEWDIGIAKANGVRHPSIKSLQAGKGKVWHGGQSSTEGKYFKRRQPLFKSIAMRIESGRTEDQAIDEFQTMMDVEGWSLRKLCNTLKARLN